MNKLPYLRLKFIVDFLKKSMFIAKVEPLDPGLKLNIHKTFRRCPGYLIYVKFTFCVPGKDEFLQSISIFFLVNHSELYPNQIEIHF